MTVVETPVRETGVKQSEPPAVLEALGLEKRFGGVRALRGADLIW